MTALRAIHAGIRALGIEEDDARDLYERQTGKRSLKIMTPREQEAVVGELRRLGFKPASKAGSKGLQGRFAKKLQALWIAGWNLGLVRDRTDDALLAFVRRQTGIDHVRFLRDPADARKAIEALKGWLARDGGVNWTLNPEHDFLRHECGVIAWAQFRILVPGATLVGNTEMFRRDVMAAADAWSGASFGLLGDADWRRVMNAFGDRIRKGKA